MVELVDTPGSGSGGHYACRGSSPLFCTSLFELHFSLLFISRIKAPALIRISFIGTKLGLSNQSVIGIEVALTEKKQCFFESAIPSSAPFFYLIFNYLLFYKFYFHPNKRCSISIFRPIPINIIPPIISILFSKNEPVLSPI